MNTTTPNHATFSRDPWSIIAELDDGTVGALAERLDVRAADPQQHQLWVDFLARARFPEGARILDVGSGTGMITEMIAALPSVADVVGVDPSPGLVERARARVPGLTFDVGDGRDLPYGDDNFDGVVFATTLCHVPDPMAALREARRVLRRGGSLLIYEGDYASASVSLSPHDPLQACVAAGVTRMVNDPWIVRRLAPMVAAAGFVVGELRSHGYVDAAATYIPTLAAAGAAALLENDTISQPLAEALNVEARARSEAGRFFGQIGYASLIATRAR